jgi:hypothetical protein
LKKREEGTRELTDEEVMELPLPTLLRREGQCRSSFTVNPSVEEIMAPYLEIS